MSDTTPRVPQNVIDAVTTVSRYLMFLQETLSRNGTLAAEATPVQDFTAVTEQMNELHTQVAKLDTSFESWKKRKAEADEMEICPACNEEVSGLFSGVCLSCKGDALGDSCQGRAKDALRMAQLRSCTIASMVKMSRVVGALGFDADGQTLFDAWAEAFRADEAHGRAFDDAIKTMEVHAKA